MQKNANHDKADAVSILRRIVGEHDYGKSWDQAIDFLQQVDKDGKAGDGTKSQASLSGDVVNLLNEAECIIKLSQSGDASMESDYAKRVDWFLVEKNRLFPNMNEAK